MAVSLAVMAGRLAAAEASWDEGAETSSDSSGPTHVVSAKTDWASIGVQGPGADGVIKTVLGLLKGKPDGTKVRLMLGQVNDGSGHWKILYVRSSVLLDDLWRPDGIETFVTQMGVVGIEGYRSIPWKNGSKNGLEQEYQLGKLRSEVSWKNDKIDGARRSFFSGGKLECETMYVNGLANGPTRMYDAEGGLVREGVMKNGKRDGTLTEYWESSSQPKRVATYRDGKADGVMREYYLSGKLKREATFKNDSYHGEEKQYNEDGKITLTRYWINGDSVTQEDFKNNAGK
jgi:antitoxin component YwqK of YwqJK toxin-antitoxin module